MITIRKSHLILFSIVILGAFFRFYNLNWDENFSLHPDERAIIMYTLPLTLPSSINDFFSPQSPLNPHFFAYGNFPLYFLKIVSSIVSIFNPILSTYGGIHLVGRFISVIADLGIIFVVFLIGKKIFSEKIGLISSFLYAIFVFPIQASHFYAVDILLTFFIILTLYQILCFYDKPSFKNALFTGISFGFALATKVSAIPLVVAIFFAISIDFLLIFLKQPHKFHMWIPHFHPITKRLLTEGLLIITVTCITFLILQPYAFIAFEEFVRDNLLQSQMTHNAFIFPYTLQYVGITPFFYQIKNVFLWGLGPILGTIAFLGIGYILFSIAQKQRANTKASKETILLTFFIVYFGIVGGFAVGWMRYMLPLYPLLALFGGILIFEVLKWAKQKISFHLFTIYCLLLIILLLIWPLSFMHIYTQSNTRIQATEWILKNIPPGKTFAIEHWDDSLPMKGQENYKIITLPLYDPDTSQKWDVINQSLSQTDYIIIASNRLYVPLQKLIHCELLPPGKCYPQTAEYYKKLFNNELGFIKVAEFSVYPIIPIFNIPINDQSADEAFTVYDHPKVIIFKNEQKIQATDLQKLITSE